jgi:predicted MPP superfamily phosphohydrolase
MITLVWRTDVHLSDHTPRSRTDNWTETVLRKLTAVGDIARNAGAHAVIDGGDFFDLKAPGRNSHALIQRVMAVHRGYPCPVYANVGNHDCVYGDYSYLPQQPLGVLYEAGTFRRLYESTFSMQTFKLDRFSIPLYSGNFSAKITLLDWSLGFINFYIARVKKLILLGILATSGLVYGNVTSSVDRYSMSETKESTDVCLFTVYPTLGV